MVSLVRGVSTLALVAFYGLFAYSHWSAFSVKGQVASILFFLLESCIVMMVCIRGRAITVSRDVGEWLTAGAMTAAPLFIRPVMGSPVVSVLEIVESCGVGLALCAVLALNRSFGIVPSNRGIKTRGVYKVVRHPLYAGYLITVAAFVAQNMSVGNGVALSAYVCFLYWRIRDEEKHLRHDVAYRGYATRVRWRIVPGIW